MLAACCARGQCRAASMRTPDGSVAHRQPCGTCTNGTCRANPPLRVGMIPSPLYSSLFFLFFFFFVFTDTCLGICLRTVYEASSLSTICMNLLPCPLHFPPLPPIFPFPLCPLSYPFLYLLCFFANLNVDAHKSGC